MKETENKAKMQTLKKESVKKRIFYHLRPRMVWKWVFMIYLDKKRTDMNQKKPTIASTTSELSDGLRKNNSFMPKYIENVPKLCVWLQLFWVVMQHLSFSQSKLSKRFQFQTIEISNVIVASLDIRSNFSNESKSEK